MVYHSSLNPEGSELRVFVLISCCVVLSFAVLCIYHSLGVGVGYCGPGYVAWFGGGSEKVRVSVSFEGISGTCLYAGVLTF